MSRRSCVGRSGLEQVAEYSTKATPPCRSDSAAHLVTVDEHMNDLQGQCQQQPALSSWGTVEFPPGLDSECEWLVANDVVSADVVSRNRQVAEAALRRWTPVFIHGDRCWATAAAERRAACGRRHPPQPTPPKMHAKAL
jgi:hypothetical protein